MATSFRLVYPHVNWKLKANYNHPAIRKDSAIIMTATEIDLSRPAEGSKTLGRPFIGDAQGPGISNICPHNPEGDSPNGGVEFIVWSGYQGGPIAIMVTVTVMDDIESFDIQG